MVERQHLRRAPGLARALGLLVLLLGVVAMHAAIFVVGGHSHATASGHDSAMEVHAASPDQRATPARDTLRDTRAHPASARRAEPADNTPAAARDHVMPATAQSHAASSAASHRVVAYVAMPAAASTAVQDNVVSRQAKPSNGLPASDRPFVATDRALPADGNHGAGGADCAGGGCGGAHGGMHGCVFILVGVALLLGLVLLYRVGVTRPGADIARVRRRRPRRERSPPWTVLSLAELSILRI